jgi:hypothetical protein
MRGMRGLAGALMLVVLAGESRAQYPYPQPNPYGYGGYGPYPGAYSPMPYGPPAGYAPPAPAPSYGSAPYGNAPYGNQPLPMNPNPAGPPIFMQSEGPQAPVTQNPGTNLPPILPNVAPRTAPPMPPSGTAAPQVIVPSQPSMTTSFPRNLPSDPKREPAALPEKIKKPATHSPEVSADGKKNHVGAPPRPDAGDDDDTSERAPVSQGPPAPQQLIEGPASNGADFHEGLGHDELGSEKHDSVHPRIWGGVEYLLWWMKNEPISVPLVTTNPLTSTPGGVIGAIGEPGTQVIFGQGSGRNFEFGAFNGGRFSLGGWLDHEGIFGIEGNGFVLERRTAFFTAGSAGGTAPVVSIPFFATEPFLFNPAGETAINTGGGPNIVTATSSSHLWGLEINGAMNWSNRENFRLVGLAGFRYLNLTENFILTDIAFLPATAETQVVQDNFGTQNHFYGGQIGVRTGGNFGRLTVDGTAKVAFGDNSQILNVAGFTRGAGGLPSSNSGIFAEPSNSGHFHHDEFSVVPEFQFQVGYLLNPYVRPFVGYNFIYFTRVLRPTDQLDRNINITQNPSFGGTNGVVTGFPSPLPKLVTSDFWAQGVNFGVEFRY